MAEARSQDSNISLLSDMSSDILNDVNDLSETLMIRPSKPCSNPSDSWESDIDMLFSRMLIKIQTKKGELKRKEEMLETFKKSLDEEYNKKINEYEEKKKEVEKRKIEIESEYSKKIQVMFFIL